MTILDHSVPTAVAGLVNPDDVSGRLEVAKETVGLLERLPEFQDDAPLSGDETFAILQAVVDETEDKDLGAVHLPGIPDEAILEDYSDWTAGLVRQCVDAVAAHEAKESADLLAAAVWHSKRDLAGMQTYADEWPTICTECAASACCRMRTS